ncbi:MAG: hypothetical protein HZB33_09160 [Nitrospirae bacterium]|nr:hypothetical protein [Nitrospirota bacterium]
MLFNDRRQCQGRSFRSSRAYFPIVIFILCLSLLPSVAIAVSSGIYFEVIPQNPTTADDIKVKTYFPGGPYVDTHSHSVIGNQINIVLFMDGMLFSPDPPHDVTETIGKLPAGEYQITVFVKESPSNPLEIDTLYGSLSVKQAVTVPTVNEYGMLILLLSFSGISLYFLKRSG